MESGDSFLLSCAKMNRFFVILKVGVMSDQGEHTGFQLGFCNLQSFPPGRQGGSNQWVLETKEEVRDFKSHKDDNCMKINNFSKIILPQNV